MIRTSVYAASVALLILAAVAVPLPLVEIAPGAATSIPELVTVEGTETTPINGELSLLTVSLGQPSLAEAARAWLSPMRDLALRAAVIPSGVGRQDYFRAQRHQFAREFDVAAAVGARHAGYDVDLVTAVYVAQVLPGGPSDGILQEGDLIVAFNGEPVRSAEDLVARTGAVAPGTAMEVTVDRGDETLGLTVVAGQLAPMDQPGFGILVETIADAVELPFTVEMARDTRIGGPSAGMMIALTVYDLLADDDLVAGRDIAGTGTVDGEGVVGPIGGVDEKVVAARRAGVDVLIVPSVQATAARAGDVRDLEVIGVTSVEDAIRQLG